MSVCPQDILAFADTLASGTSEIEWRNSAARAYYAGYHMAALVAVHCPSNDHLAMGSHERISNRFDLENSVKAKSISYVLQAMKRVRKTADYELEGVFPQASARSQVDLGTALFNKLDLFAQNAAARSA